LNYFIKPFYNNNSSTNIKVYIRMFDSMEVCRREIMELIIHRIQYYGGGGGAIL
jgi:hypothetical protein